MPHRAQPFAFHALVRGGTVPFFTWHSEFPAMGLNFACYRSVGMDLNERDLGARDDHAQGIGGEPAAAADEPSSPHIRYRIRR